MKRKVIVCLLVLGLLSVCAIGLTSCKECKHELLTYAETVAPTCVAEGSESALCPVCAETLTRPIPARGHSFEDGFCGGCQTGLYTNLLSSLQKEGMTLLLDDLKLTTVSEDPYGDPITTVYTQTDPTYFSFDGTEGTAVCHMRMTTVVGDGMANGSMETNDIKLLLTLSLENGVAATVTVKQDMGGGLFAEATVFSFASIDATADGSEELAAVLTELAPLFTRTDEQRNAACRALLSFLSPEKTENGYRFAPDPDAVKAQVDRLFDAESFFAALDVLYGEGAVEHIRTELRILCSLTVREAWDKLEAAGVDTERLWSAVKTLTESETDLLADPAVLPLRLYQVIEALATETPLPTAPITAEEAGAAFDTLWNEKVLPDGEKSLAELMEMTDAEWREAKTRTQEMLDEIFAALSLTYETDALGHLTAAAVTFDLSKCTFYGPPMTDGQGILAEGIVSISYEATKPEEKHAFDINKVLSDISETEATLPVVQDEWLLEGAAAMMVGDTLRVSAEPEFAEYRNLIHKRTGQIMEAYVGYTVTYTASAKLTVKEIKEISLSPTDRTGVYELTIILSADKAVLGLPKLIGAYTADTYEELSVSDYTFAESPTVSLENTEIAVRALYNSVTGAVTSPIFEEEDPDEPEYPEDPEEDLFLVCFYEEDGETLIDAIYAEYGEDITEYVEYFVYPETKAGYEFYGWQCAQNVSLYYVTGNADFYPIYLPVDDGEDEPPLLAYDGCIPLVDGITVDGFWDDAYENAAILPLDTSRQADNRTETRVFTDLDGVAYLVWDGEYIYVYVKVADSTLGGRSQAYMANVFNAYLNDTVEVYYSLYQGDRDSSSMKIGVDSMGVGKYCTKKRSEVEVGNTNCSTHFDEILFATTSAITPHGEHGSYNEELTEEPFHWGSYGEYSYCVEIAIPARTEGVADIYNSEGLTVDPRTGFIYGRENADGSRTDDPDDYRFTDGDALLAGDLARFNLQIIDLPLTREQLADPTSDYHESEELDATVGRNHYLYDADGREVMPAFCAYGHTQSDLSRYLTFVLGGEGEEGYSRIYDFDEYGNPLDAYGEITELYAAE